MKKELDGVIWDLNELSFETPFPSDRGKSCSFFLQSLATFTWNTLRSFEETEKSEGDGRIDHVIEKSIELFKTVPIMNQCKSLVSIWKK